MSDKYTYRSIGIHIGRNKNKTKKEIPSSSQMCTARETFSDRDLVYIVCRALCVCLNLVDGSNWENAA